MVSDVLDARQAASLPAPVTVTSGALALPVAHWDRYELLELLGRGGMGSVYKARDRRLGRVVALKFISGDDPALAQRFMQEARAQARLEHPHICKVYEVGSVDGKPYIAMEFVSGQTLDKVTAKLSMADKLRIMKDAAEAVHAAHEQGIVHRDLKPSNILVEDAGAGRYRPVIMDFGLARDSDNSATHGLTESGAVMGTPAYMSPEQARGDAKRLDRRSDVYSLGATLYDVLTGKPPFEDQTVVNVLLKVISEAPRPLRSHSDAIPEAVELIVSKCLNKEPEQRYPSAQALAEDLGRYLAAQRVVARRLSYSYRLLYWARRNRALAALAVGLVLSLLGLAGFGVRTRILALEKQEQAKKEAALAQKLGQAVEGLEWLMRTAYLLPLHDTRYEKGLVRERMAVIAAELEGEQGRGARLGAYVLGRGHLALQEWDAANSLLGRAAQLGYRDAELDYALGRVLGELYSRALADARRSGDSSFFAQRKRELRLEYLEPALTHLQKSRHLKTVSANYVDGLIDYYEDRHDAALLNAHMARRKTPWLYEAAKLEGDVLLARALEQRGHGELDEADRSFADSLSRYGQAAAIGHSDPLVHEAMAEAWLRWEESDMQRGRDPEPKREAALAAADRALEAAPAESYGDIKKAFAFNFYAQYAQNSGKLELAKSIYLKQIESARLALDLHPNDAYAHESKGIAYLRLAEIQLSGRRSIQSEFAQAKESFELALKHRPRFPWAWNDYSVLLTILAAEQISHHQDPTAALDESDRFGRQAAALDPDYVYAYNTLMIGILYRVKWLTDHGLSPFLAIQELANINAQISRTNSNFVQALGNSGAIFYYVSIYQADRMGDSVSPGLKSIEYFEKMLRLNPGIPGAYAGVALAYSVLAAQPDLTVPPAASAQLSAVQQGLSTVEKCYKIAAGFPDCQAAEALLRAAQAEELRRLGRPHVPKLEQAYALARKAAAQNPDSEELQLSLAQVAHALALARAARGGDARAAAAEGTAAAEHALRISTGWPRALAQKGALLLLHGKVENNRGLRLQLLRAAQESFAQSFAGNPLLKQRFGALAEEAQQLEKGS